MTERKIDSAINTLGGLIGQAGTALVNLHYACSVPDPDLMQYALEDLRDVRTSLDQTLGGEPA